MLHPFLAILPGVRYPPKSAPQGTAGKAPDQPGPRACLQMDDLSQATQLARLASEYSDNGLPVQAYTLSQVGTQVRLPCLPSRACTLYVYT